MHAPCLMDAKNRKLDNGCVYRIDACSTRGLLHGKVSATSMSARQQSDPSIAEKLLSFTKLNKNVHLIKRSRLEWWNLDIQNERVLLPAICARICFSFFRLSSTFVTKLLWYTFCNMVLMSLVLSLFTVVHCCLTVNLGVNSRHQK